MDKKEHFHFPDILDDLHFREAVRLLVRYIYPAMRVLRLCDKSEAGMDRLLYYVCKADDSLDANKRLLNSGVQFFDKNEEARDDDSLDGTMHNSEELPGDGMLGSVILNLWQEYSRPLKHDYAKADTLLRCQTCNG